MNICTESHILGGFYRESTVCVDSALGCSPGSSRGVNNRAHIVSFAAFYILLKELGQKRARRPLPATPARMARAAVWMVPVPLVPVVA